MAQKSKKPILIVILAYIGFIVIVLVVSLIIKNLSTSSNNSTDKTIIIDNQSSYSKGVNPAVFSNISGSAYSITSLNIENAENTYHGIIRDNTFSNITNNSVSFILDIPSIKVSWLVGQGLDNTGAPLSDTSVLCVTESQAIYPLLDICKDISTGFQTSDQLKFMEIVKILPLTGPTYSVGFSKSTVSDNYTLIITTYSEGGKQDALNAIKLLGYNPDNYEITYNNGS